MYFSDYQKKSGIFLEINDEQKQQIFNVVSKFYNNVNYSDLDIWIVEFITNFQNNIQRAKSSNT